MKSENNTENTAGSDCQDLFARALEIERNAILNSPGRGLGGQSLRWENVDAQDEAQGKLWDYLDENDESPIPCGCYDGVASDE